MASSEGVLDKGKERWNENENGTRTRMELGTATGMNLILIFLFFSHLFIFCVAILVPWMDHWYSTSGVEVVCTAIRAFVSFIFIVSELSPKTC